MVHRSAMGASLLEAEMAQGASFNDFFHDFGAHGHSWEDMFGSFQQRARSRPFIIRAQMDATLEDIYQGVHKTFELDGQAVSFNIPPTIRPDRAMIIKLQSGQELHIGVNLIRHPRFTLRGDDLYSHVSVPVHTAIKGGEVLVPTLDGTISLHIPPYTNSHSKLRAKNVGMKLPAGGRASIIYEVKINTRDLSPELKEWKLKQ